MAPTTKMKRRQNNPQALKGGRDSWSFTLVELLVVVAVIGILVGLSLPAMNYAVAHAKNIKCTSNLREIFVATQSYASDNEGSIVPVYIKDAYANSTNLWTGLLAPYMGRTSGANFASASELPACVCPLHPLRFGYGYNYSGLSYPWRSPSDWPPLPLFLVMANVKNPSQTVFFCDSKYSGPSDEGFYSWRAYVRPATWGASADFPPRYEHPGKTCNALWVDGHISAEKENGPWVDYKYWGGE